jgi:hypothetical protein
MFKKKSLGHGLKLTQSDDMVILLHFKSKSGKMSGIRLNQDSRDNPNLLEG